MSSEAEDCRLWYPYNPDVFSAVTLLLIGWRVTALFSHMCFRNRHTAFSTTFAECRKIPKGACAYCENSAIEVASYLCTRLWIMF